MPARSPGTFISSVINITEERGKTGGFEGWVCTLLGILFMIVERSRALGPEHPCASEVLPKVVRVEVVKREKLVYRYTIYRYIISF